MPAEAAARRPRRRKWGAGLPENLKGPRMGEVVCGSGDKVDYLSDDFREE